MIRIGIADDRSEDIKSLQALCSEYLNKTEMEHMFYTFLSGEEVLEYCRDESSKELDLLFLDIEMPGIDGLKVQEFSRSTDKIFRIAYASSHDEWMEETYDCNVIGFLKKPLAEDKVHRVLAKVMRERIQNVPIQLPGMKWEIRLEELEYMKSDKNYVEVHICNKGMEKLLTTTMHSVEKQLQNMPIVRVHKSYMVNLLHVKEIKNQIQLKHNDLKIPVGRTYKAKVKEQYDEFRRKMVRGRMG